ncbi:helix-turn-helix domain-containing protein [Goodfellowiella coeruleoviolacea]|uniref:DNA binding domain-containing protein, excisionase family n=1 Tax=Goodfellowiella coeruleoviolacea TaxID=334858 RepID=A0AAE3GJM9_9PSEU|nr:helix-turn-helix domain-containing protein [Goodfellowiella coeruleoviolacea]MCP2169436.1 DNA binding domain-containing protein, excisionase family [Goodfellowiella coeruleoviolacea]
MSGQLYSVEQVAELLGLHVRTVRTYVRDGRLAAVRIGKQYRIARADLEAFTGRPVGTTSGEDARRTRHVEVSSIVQIDAISRESMQRLSAMVMSIGTARSPEDQPLRTQIVYDEERASLKIIVLGPPDTTAEFLRMIHALSAEL